MEISGTIFKDGKFWLVDIPLLDFMTQAKTKKTIPIMIKDAIELLVGDVSFSIDVDIEDNLCFIRANDTKKLIAFMLKRLRQKNNLRLEDVAQVLQAKSINEYAQYEQAKHLPSIEKLQQLLSAVNPNRQREPIWF